MLKTQLKEEKNISELARRVYKLKAKDKKQLEVAEQALLAANPQLRNIAKLKQGTEINVPDLPPIVPKAKSSAKKNTVKTSDKSDKGDSMIDETKSEPMSQKGGSVKASRLGTSQMLSTIHDSLGNVRSSLADAVRGSAVESKQTLELLKLPQVVELGNRDPQTKQKLAQLEIDTKNRLQKLDATHQEHEQIFDLATRDLDEFFSSL